MPKCENCYHSCLKTPLKYDSGESVYVNDKYIKFFGNGVSYKGDERRVFVCEKSTDKLIGLILPIHLKEN